MTVGTDVRSQKTPLLRLVRVFRLATALLGGLVLLLLLRLVTYRFAPQAPSRLAVAFSRLLLWGLRIKVTFEGEIAVAALIVANHISWTDILVLSASQPVRFVAKSEVQKWPLLGLLARLNATIFIRREARASAQRQIALLNAAVARNSVVLFPEGTTGNGLDVLPFRPTLLASAEGQRLQPVSIVYRPSDRDWLPGELADFAWDGDKAFWPHLVAIAGGCSIDCRVVAHQAMTTTRVDRKELAIMARQIVRSAMLDLPSTRGQH